MPQDPLSIWTIYAKPADFPDHFIARRWEALDPPRPTDDLLKADDIISLRQLLPQGLVMIKAYDLDDPVIVETWM